MAQAPLMSLWPFYHYLSLKRRPAPVCWCKPVAFVRMREFFWRSRHSLDFIDAVTVLIKAILWHECKKYSRILNTMSRWVLCQPVQIRRRLVGAVVLVKLEFLFVSTCPTRKRELHRMSSAQSVAWQGKTISSCVGKLVYLCIVRIGDPLKNDVSTALVASRIVTRSRHACLVVT